MKRILSVAAFSALMSTAVLAGSHAMKFETYQVNQQQDIRASTFIGMRIYATEEQYDSLNDTTILDKSGTKEWDDIGEINDVILGRDGAIKAVILGVGGFIGIGEKDVAVPMSKIKFVKEKDGKDEFFLVVKANKELLTKADMYEKSPKAGMEKSDESTKAVLARTRLVPPPVKREGYRQAKVEELSAEALTGARVYGSNNEDIGEIDQLILDDSGQVKHAVIDVGGFLGIGEHPIAVTLDELIILRTDGGDDVRVYIDATQATLKKQPAYKR